MIKLASGLALLLIIQNSRKPTAQFPTLENAVQSKKPASSARFQSSKTRIPRKEGFGGI